MADDPTRKPKEQAKLLRLAADVAEDSAKQAKLMEQKEGKGSDDSPTELSSRFKFIEQKVEERSDDSTTKLAGPSKSMEEKGEERSGDSTAKLAGPSKISKPTDLDLSLQRRRSRLEVSMSELQELDLQRQRISLEMSELRDQELDLRRQMISLEMSKPAYQEWSLYTSAENRMSELQELDLQRQRISLEVSQLRKQGFDLRGRRSLLEVSSMKEKGGKRSGDSTAKLASASKGLQPLKRRGRRYDDLTTESVSPSKSKELEGVLLHTRRLILHDINSYSSIRLRGEGKKSGQDTDLTDDARLGLQVHVDNWMSTDDETHLQLRDGPFLQELISILASLCRAVKHISIDLHMIHPDHFTNMPMPMISVKTIYIKSLYCSETLCETLLAVSKSFPNAESLDLQVINLHLYNKAYTPEFNSSSTLRELKLRYEARPSDDVAADSLFLDISTSYPNIVSLVLSGIGRYPSDKSGKDISLCILPHLTDIHLEPFRTDDCCRFEPLLNVLHVVHVTSPRLKFVEAKKVQLGGAKLSSVKWSQTSSGCELQLEGSTVAVPMADLMHLVSNELEKVTVLTFDRCKVEFPQSISHPPQGTREGSSLRELKFLNVECPLSQTDINKLSEMYPNVKVTVTYEDQASHEDSKHGTGMPFKPERKTSSPSPPSPTSSIDELVGATARVHIHEEQADTQNTEEERKMEEVEQEEEEKEEDNMESLPHEKDEVKPIKMECCKRVGVEGGKLQLDSFGIQLEIPPGAIDCEVPQEIYLSVLTDTPNLGNSEEEMSICFGVQCLAPDDLVLKLPVTYTIPHCAVIRRYPSVEAVLYTGEGEYSPDAVKEQTMLSTVGIPSCTFMKDVLILKMNHFSWAKIKLRFRKFLFRGKRMCCRPFMEKNLALQKTTVILHAHLYDDTQGKGEMVESNEGKHGFVPAHMELQVLIQAEEGDLKMTCFVNETVIGRHVVVPFNKLISGTRICEPFQLDLRNQPDIVAVALKVGQTDDLHVKFLFHLDFSTPHRRKKASPDDQEQLQGASSSQTLQTSQRSPGETLKNMSGTPVDFDEKLTTVAQKVERRDEIDILGKALGFEPEDIQRYVDTNMKASEVSYMGTLLMLRKWRKKQTKATECEALKGVLRKAGQKHLAFELFGT